MIEGWSNYKNVNIFSDEFLFFILRYLILIVSISPFLLFISYNNLKINSIWLIFFLIINIQPLIGGPLITSGNIQRLGALGIPFLFPVLLNYKIDVNKCLIFIFLTISLSLHHKFSIMNFTKKSHLYYEIILIVTPIIILINKKYNKIKII